MGVDEAIYRKDFDGVLRLTPCINDGGSAPATGRDWLAGAATAVALIADFCVVWVLIKIADE